MIKAFNKTTILEPVEEENKTKSGIVLTDNNKKTISKGKVISTTHPDLKEGDLVQFKIYSDYRVFENKRELIIIENKNILLKYAKD
jgi:chaperonin GroES